MAFIFTRAAGVICWLGVPLPLYIESNREYGFKHENRATSSRIFGWYRDAVYDDETDVEFEEGFGEPNWVYKQQRVLRELRPYEAEQYGLKRLPEDETMVRNEELVRKLVWAKQRHERVRDALRKLWKDGASRRLAQRVAQWSGPSGAMVKFTGDKGTEYDVMRLFSFANPSQARADAITTGNTTKPSFGIYYSAVGGKWVPSVHQNPYWGRLWIVQEVCLPRDLAFVVGSEIWSERTVREVMTRWQSASAETLDLFSANHPVEMMKTLLDVREERFSDTMRLEALIERFMTSSCAETRDHVFALFGLANDVHSVAPGNSDIQEQARHIGDDQDRASDIGSSSSSNTTGYTKPSTTTDTTPSSAESHRQPTTKDTKDGLPVVPKGTPSKEEAAMSLGLRFWNRSRERRGRGSLEIDYTRTFYDIWSDVVGHFYFRAKPMQDFGSSPAEMLDERSTRVVRFSAVVQKAFNDEIETELAQHVSPVRQPANPDAVIIQARGYVAGTVVYLGPSYGEFVASYREHQHWINSWDGFYHGAELEKLRQMEEEYSAKILGYGDSDLARISAIRSHHTVAWSTSRTLPGKTYTEQSPTLFAGDTKCVKPVRFLGTECCMGMVPAEARTGDLIIRFWNCDAAIVVRSVYPKQVFFLVGRADVAKLNHGDNDGQDDNARTMLKTPLSFIKDPLQGYEPKPNPPSYTGAVYVWMDLETLQKISASIAI
jgi:hypothetical protein